MILLGCLLAFGLSVAPRLFLILAWFFSERWARVWQGEFLIPLLGIILLPYTTIMYMLTWSPNGIEGWDWLWIGMGLLLDFWKWQQVIVNRQAAMETGGKYYSSMSSKGGTDASSGSMVSAAPAASSSAPAATKAAAATGAAAATAASAVEDSASVDTESPDEPSAPG